MSREAIGRKAVAQALREAGAVVHDEHPSIKLVGSAYISDRQDSDVDFVCHVTGLDPNTVHFPGWTYGGSGGEFGSNDGFGSWKKEVDGVVVNMLLCTTAEYRMRWLTAAEVCRFLHLQGYKLKAADVHGIHEIIMDDSDAEREHSRRNY